MRVHELVDRRLGKIMAIIFLFYVFLRRYEVE